MPVQRSFGVLGNYMRSIVRNFYKHRFYSFLNIVGLSIGFSVLIGAIIYFHYETHFESFHKKAEQIFRLTYQFTPTDGATVHWARTPFDYVNNLPQDLPGIKTHIRFQNHERKYVRVGQEKFRPQHTYVTDKDVFDVFSFTLVAGNPATALAEPHAIVLTQSLAEKYFGDQDPMDQEIFVIGDLDNSETSYRVTGVMEDLPPNTHLPVDMLLSYKDLSERKGWAYSYLLLQPGTDIEVIEDRMTSFVRKYEDEESAQRLSFVFQPLPSIHLNSNLTREIVPNGRAFYVRIVGIGGMFILLIAVINFMNLHSAMALGRAKEIGMRKILGASRRQLVAYLFLESVTSNILALLLGSAIVYTSFPLLQRFVPVYAIMNMGWLAAIMIAVAFACGLVAGIYPVMLLMSIQPMATVRISKTFSFVRRESPFNLKRVMVTLQFCISIIFVGSAVVVYQQFRYLGEKNLGMQRDQVVAIPGVPDNVKANFITFKNMVTQVPGIVGVAACMEVPSREIRDAGPVLVKGVNDDPAMAPNMDIQIIDHDFVNLLGIGFIAGGNIPESLLDDGLASDSTMSAENYLFNKRRAYLINETAMRRLGWQSPEDAIGQLINWSIGTFTLDYGPIVGVVRDFHQETLKNNVDPIVMVYEPVWLRTFLIKVKPDDMESYIQSIQATWDKLFPLYPMEYYFLDDLYENLYQSERVQLKLLYLFSGLAIIIAFIGLVGLTTYALKTRTKEIAIRKVMGASIPDLIRLIGREYLLVLLIGGSLAIPVSIYFLRQWLSTFAYRVDISPFTYLMTLSIAGLLLVVTISLQTFRSASASPADTLRDE